MKQQQQQFEWWLISKLIWKWAVVTYDRHISTRHRFHYSHTYASTTEVNQKQIRCGNEKRKWWQPFNVSATRLKNDKTENVCYLSAHKNSIWVSFPLSNATESYRYQTISWAPVRASFCIAHYKKGNQNVSHFLYCQYSMCFAAW